MIRTVLLVLAILLIAAGAVWFPYSQDLTAARARLAHRGETIATLFGALQYAEAGEGTAVIAIHGSGGGFDQALEMAGPLAGKGYRLIAPSRFGYLCSDAPEDMTVAKQADAFVPLLDHLGVDKAIVFGGSAGALSAMEFCIRHGERCRALVLLVPAAYAPTREPGSNAMPGAVGDTILRTVLGSDFLFWLGTTLAPDFTTRLLLATDPALIRAASPEEQARVAAIRAHIQPVSARARGLLFDMATSGSPEAMTLADIRCPVLTISVDDDLFATAAPARYIAETVPNGRSIIYPTGGHLYVGHQDDVWRAVEEFLSAIPPDQPPTERKAGPTPDPASPPAN